MAPAAGPALMFSYTTRSLVALADVPVLRHATSAVFLVGSIGLALIFALFPNGRPVPRRAWWLPAAMLGLVVAIPDAGALLMGVLDGVVDVTARAQVLVVTWFGLSTLGLGAQIHRYRHVSGPTERQQIKWVMAPIALLFLVIVVVVVLPVLGATDSDLLVGGALLASVHLGILFPVMVANAVLRYRLYEIDRIISRTVAYGLLLAILGAVYVAAVLSLGSAASNLTGRQGDHLVIAVSVLLVVSIFRPLQRRIHTAVDRRFNRSGYGGRQAVETFAQRLRGEVQLDAIRHATEGTAVAAMQPEHVSVWLLPRRWDV